MRFGLLIRVLATLVLVTFCLWELPRVAQPAMGQDKASIGVAKPKQVLSEKDLADVSQLIQRRIESCWKLTVKKAPATVPVLYAEVDPTGKLLTPPKLENPMDDEAFMQVAKSGIEAVTKCKTLNIPARFHYGYQDYKKLLIRLDPMNVDQKN